MDPKSRLPERLFEALQHAKGECPDGEQILAYHHQELPQPERRHLEEHFALCGICQELLDRLRSAPAELDDVAWKRTANELDRRTAPWRARDKTQPASPRFNFRLWGAAAAIMLVAVSLSLWRIGRDSTNVPSPPAPTTRGHSIQLYEPAGQMDAISIFSWGTLPISHQFRLEIRQGNRPIWSATVEGERYRPPAELMRLLAPGERFEWRIEAIDREGKVVAESPWLGFQRSP